MTKSIVTPLVIMGTLGLVAAGGYPLVKAFNSLDGSGKKQVGMVVVVTTILIFAAGYLTLSYLNRQIDNKNMLNKKEGKPMIPNVSVKEFLNGSSLSMKSVLVGMVSGLVFGFIDNAGLYLGMDKLDPLFEAMGAGNLAKSGLGNTFSDMLGGFISTFAGIVIQQMSGESETPIWSEVVGLIIGCIMGIFIPMYGTGKKFSE
jgi:hypothetical protein